MRLLTYNVHGCLGKRSTFDAANILEVIRRADADVVALQEVHNDSDPALSFVDQLESLGYASIHHGPTMTNPRGNYGNVCLTRRRSVLVRKIDLSQPGFEPRGAVRIHLDHEGHRFDIISTHLGLAAAEREAQLERLAREFHDDSADSIQILMGDLNEWNGRSRRERLLSGLFAPKPHPRTFPAKFPLFRLDRVHLSSDSVGYTVKVLKDRLSKRASDHLPLVADLKID